MRLIGRVCDSNALQGTFYTYTESFFNFVYFIILIFLNVFRRIVVFHVTGSGCHSLGWYACCQCECFS
jgi:hypothetical protein